MTNDIIPIQTQASNITTNNNNLLGDIADTRGFKIASLNINSLPAHIDELQVYMGSQTIDILALNETRLDNSISSDQMFMLGCVLERNNRNRNGGGVAFYIRNTINYELMHELKDDQLEWLCIKVKKPKTKPFIVSTWYRSPGSTSDIMKSFESLIEKLDTLGLEHNIVGDLNC